MGDILLYYERCGYMESTALRSKYSRSNTYYKKRRTHTGEKVRIKEIIAKQTTISIFIFVALFIIKIIDTPVTNYISGKVKWFLQQDISVNDIMNKVNTLIDGVINGTIWKGQLQKSENNSSGNENEGTTDASDKFHITSDGGIDSSGVSGTAETTNPGFQSSVYDSSRNSTSSNISNNPNDSVSNDSDGLKTSHSSSSPNSSNNFNSSNNLNNTNNSDNTYNTDNTDNTYNTDNSVNSNGSRGIRNAGSYENSTVQLDLKLIAPVEGKVSLPFGPCIDPITQASKFHYGLDIDTEKGTLIKAAAKGEVLEITEDKMYGRNIKIKHQDGTITVYAHCSKMYQVEGSKVDQGDIIAEVGDTGYSTGTHLHFEIWKNGEALDPALYIDVE
jgi:murein DD-endopeptidase MepM/ murein hydrolase activator NlpD